MEDSQAQRDAAERLVKALEGFNIWVEKTQEEIQKALQNIASFADAALAFNLGMQQAIENMPKPENPEIGDRWYDGKNKMLTEWDGRQWLEVLPEDL